MSLINAVIHVVSNTGLGYMGTLAEMDVVNHTFTIRQVRCLGTEGRAPGNEMPALEHEVFPIIVFNSSDVKSLQVVTLPPPSATPPPPRSVFDAPPAPAPAPPVLRSVFDQPAGSSLNNNNSSSGGGPAIVTIHGLASGVSPAQVGALFPPETSQQHILSIRVLALPVAHHQPSSARYAADVVFASPDAASQAVREFAHEGLSIDFAHATTPQSFDANRRGGGGFMQDSRRKNADTFGPMAYTHRTGGGGGGRGGGRGGYYTRNNNNNNNNYNRNNGNGNPPPPKV